MFEPNKHASVQKNIAIVWLLKNAGNVDFDHSNSATTHQTSGTGSRGPNLTEQVIDEIYKELLADSNKGKKKKYSSQDVAHKFVCSIRTV